MRIATYALVLCLCSPACITPVVISPDYGRPLVPGAQALLPLGDGETPPDLSHVWRERGAVQAPLKRSIKWTSGAYSRQFFPMAGIEHERALKSLKRFEELLEVCDSPASFNQAVQDEFQVYKSAGWDSRGGGVLFTGYCTPILEGSLEYSKRYAYPLYGLPGDLKKGLNGKIEGQITEAGVRPYPVRRVIESNKLLSGLEVVWLGDPLDAYIAHVNGSAVVRLPNGEEARFGYAGKNGRDYTSLGKELVNAGEIGAGALSLAAIRGWARKNPNNLEKYTQRNDSYVFFTRIEGNPRGSLNLEVAAHRTLATDKTLFPRGALTYVDTYLPTTSGGTASFKQLMFDQDTGGAIRTAGRADIYLGIGYEAELRAGATQSRGQLYYLFLKE